MKRLINKLAASALLSFRERRLVRKSEWVDVSVSDPNLVQDITNIMASGGQMQILYNGEWKLINPYGWNTSKAGNILLMCYKDTGEVRSYRFDRVEETQLDSQDVGGDEFEDNGDSGSDMFDVPEDNTQPSSSNEELPFEDELGILEKVDDDEQPEQEPLDKPEEKEPETQPAPENDNTDNMVEDDKLNDESEDDQQAAV